MTPEQIALAKAAGLERDRAERGRMLRQLERMLRVDAAQAAMADLPNVRDMPAPEYARFKRRTLRALAGL